MQLHKNVLGTIADAAPGSADAAAASVADELLRRTVSRLCIAARGADARLDRCLVALTTLVRRPVRAAELEPLLRELTTAIGALDEAAAGEASPARGAPPLRDLLMRLLERLAAVPALQAQVDGLREQLRKGAAEREPIKAVNRIADLVNEQHSALQREKTEVERLLAQVTGRLDEMARHLSREAEVQQQAQDDTREINTRLLGQVRELDSNVREATELDALQRVVRTRLEMIDGHLQELRERDESRMRDFSERSERMRTRIEQLERETLSLQDSVQREQRAALTDPLTGIANRLAWSQKIEDALRRWKRFARPLCVAVWDIDRFKPVNDTYGHAAGDKLLQVVARILARHVRETDFVARYGGEEFVMLLEGAAAEEALQLAEKLRQMVEAIDFKVRDASLRVTVSCGLAALVKGDSAESVFERADAALYRAKREGRNRCVPG